MPSACVSLPGPEQRSRSRSAAGDQAAALAHQLDPGDRRERADQHRRADARGLATALSIAWIAVGAVDVGAARRAEQRLRARRQPGEGVAGRLALVVGLGLDDHAGRVAVHDCAADQLRRDLEHRAVIERSRQRPSWLRDVRLSSSGAAELTARQIELLAQPRRGRAALGDLRLQPRALREHRAELVAVRGQHVAVLRELARRSAATASGRRRAPCARARRRLRAPRGRAAPRRTSRSATSVAAISSSDAASRRRSRSKRAPPTMPVAAASVSSSVSTASNRCSLSSCRSLL